MSNNSIIKIEIYNFWSFYWANNIQLTKSNNVLYKRFKLNCFTNYTIWASVYRFHTTIHKHRIRNYLNYYENQKLMLKHTLHKILYCFIKPKCDTFLIYILCVESFRLSNVSPKCCNLEELGQIIEFSSLNNTKFKIRKLYIIYKNIQSYLMYFIWAQTWKWY